MRRRTKVAVVENGCLAGMYSSVADCARGEGVDYTTMFNRAKTGKEYNGRTYIRTDYQMTPIICMKNGHPEGIVPSLMRASFMVGLTQKDILGLFDSGDSVGGWTFDEVGQEAYPKTRMYGGLLYHRGEWGYKTGIPSTYLHRDMYEAEIGPLEGKHLSIRNGNQWDFRVEGLV
jgi:hypothetical protein